MITTTPWQPHHNLKCYQVSKLEIEFRMMTMIYAALRVRAHNIKDWQFHAKTWMYKGVGARDQKPNLFTKGATICLPLKVVFQWSSSSTEGRLPSKVVFHQGSSSTEGRLPPKVIFHQRCLPSNFVFHWRSSSTKGRLPPKVVFHQRSFPPKVIFHRRSSSTEGCLPPIGRSP